MSTLPTDSDARKGIPLITGPFSYFPAAFMLMAQTCRVGHLKHCDPDEPLYHDRSKSGDHKDAIGRHLMDINDIEAEIERTGDEDGVLVESLLSELGCLAWRACALAQETAERYGAPVAPAARDFGALASS